MNALPVNPGGRPSRRRFLSMAGQGVEPGPLAEYLIDKHKILVIPITHPEFKGLRVTPNLYTTLPELDRFCEVMTAVAKKGLPAG